MAVALELVEGVSRRTLDAWLAGVAIHAPGLAAAQASKAIRRIGVLEPGSPAPPEFLWSQAAPLRERGWIEGKNLDVERRYADDRPEALDPLAQELVRARVELIVSGGTAATVAAKRASTTIPIVFRTAGDPVRLGLVASLARPGGNVTGFSRASPEITAKMLSVLKDALPGMQRVGVVRQSGNPYDLAMREQFEQVCRSLTLTPTVAEIRRPEDIAGAIDRLVRQRVQAVVLGYVSLLPPHDAEIVDIATKHGLPTMTDDPDLMRRTAALIAYGELQVEEDRTRADYIDRILRGARPADLPVRQPTRFELVINLKTARTLGLTIPKDVLLRADEVMQ